MVVTRLFGGLLLFALLIVGQGGQAAAPQRIVSLSVCGDQFVLGMVEPERIAAVSHYALDPNLSIYKDRAEQVAVTRGSLEEVLALQPDLVVANRWGNSKLLSGLEALGYPILRLTLPTTIEDAFAETERAGEALGVAETARILIAEARQNLRNLSEPDISPKGVYIMPGGFTAGQNSFVDAVFQAAGVRNIAAEAGKSGWGSLSIEELIMAEPELLAFSFFRTEYSSLKNRYRRHHALQEVGDTAKSVDIPSQYWVCGAWFLYHAANTLAEAR